LALTRKVRHKDLIKEKNQANLEKEVKNTSLGKGKEVATDPNTHEHEQRVRERK